MLKLFLTLLTFGLLLSANVAKAEGVGDWFSSLFNSDEIVESDDEMQEVTPKQKPLKEIEQNAETGEVDEDALLPVSED